MKALLPGYGARPREQRPGSLLVSGPYGHYIVGRTDMRLEDTATMNPHLTAYWVCSLLTLDTAFERRLPLSAHRDGGGAEQHDRPRRRVALRAAD
jgi:hypothetical protein